MDNKNLYKLHRIITLLKSLVKCPLCLGNIKHSIQLKCGHQFCSICFQSYTQGKVVVSCPLCNVTINFKNKSFLYQDGFMDSLSNFIEATFLLIKDRYGQEDITVFSKNENSKHSHSEHHITEICGDEISKIPISHKRRSLMEKIVNGEDNYQIEESGCETFVKEIERKVLQQVLEDKCLDNLENISENMLARNIQNHNLRKAIINTNGNKSNSSLLASKLLGNEQRRVKKLIKRKPKTLKISLHSTTKRPKTCGQNQTKKINRKEPLPYLNSKIDVKTENAENSCKMSERLGENEPPICDMLVQYEKLCCNKAPSLKDINASINENIQLLHNQLNISVMEVTNNIGKMYQKNNNLLDCFNNMKTYIAKIQSLKPYLENFINTKQSSTQTEVLHYSSQGIQTEKLPSLKYKNQSVMTEAIATPQPSLQQHKIMRNSEVQTEIPPFLTYQDDKTLENVLTDLHITKSTETLVDLDNNDEQLNLSKENINQHLKIVPEIRKADVTDEVPFVTANSNRIFKKMAVSQSQSNKSKNEVELNSECQIKTQRKYKRIRSPPTSFTNDHYNTDECEEPSKKRFNANITVEFSETELTVLSSHDVNSVQHLNSLAVNKEFDFDASENNNTFEPPKSIEPEINNKFNNRINILQDIQLNSYKGFTDYNTENVNGSDEEIELIENTPQKITNKPIIEVSLRNKQLEVFNVVITPPPGFNDDINNDNEVSVVPRLQFESNGTKKSSDNILETSTLTKKNISNYIECYNVSSEDGKEEQKASHLTIKKPRVTWSRIIDKDINIFKQLEKRNLIDISSEIDERVTHLIVLADGNDQIKFHTAKFLLAIAARIWIVRYEWALDSLKAQRTLPEEPYEVLDSSGIAGPKISRLTGKSNPLFRNFRFYCSEPFSIVSKIEIQNALIKLGAEIEHDLHSILKVRGDDKIIRIILTDSTATEDLDQFDTWIIQNRIATVDIEWLTKCIGQYKIVSLRPYVLCSDEDRLLEDLNYPSILIEPSLFDLSD